MERLISRLNGGPDCGLASSRDQSLAAAVAATGIRLALCFHRCCVLFFALHLSEPSLWATSSNCCISLTIYEVILFMERGEKGGVRAGAREVREVPGLHRKSELSNHLMTVPDIFLAARHVVAAGYEFFNRSSTEMIIYARAHMYTPTRGYTHAQ